MNKHDGTSSPSWGKLRWVNNHCLAMLGGYEFFCYPILCQFFSWDQLCIVGCWNILAFGCQTPIGDWIATLVANPQFISSWLDLVSRGTAAVVLHGDIDIVLANAWPTRNIQNIPKHTYCIVNCSLTLIHGMYVYIYMICALTWI